MSPNFQAPARGTGALFRRWLLQPPLSRLTIAARIAGLMLALALPLNLVIAAAFWHLSGAASELQRTGLLYMARTVAAAADAKLGGYIALAQALARSRALLESELEAFEAEARHAFASDPNATVTATDLGGQQARAAGAPGPRAQARNSPLSASQQRALETQSVVIGGIHEDPVSKAWSITIAVPVLKDEKPFRLLSVAVKAQAFYGLFNEQHLPKHWAAAIIDAQGRFVARAPSDEGSAGQLAPAVWSTSEGQESGFEILSTEGRQAARAYARSAMSGWLAAVSVKKPFLQSAVWGTIRLAMIFTAGLSVISLLSASAMARGITGSIEELRLKAGALLTGRALPALPPGPPEVGELWQALKQSAADRDRSEQALRESEAKLRLALDAAQFGTWRWEAGKGAREMQWDPLCMALFGLPPATCVTYEVWANSILPEDRDRAEANVARALDPADPQDETFCDYRVRHPDGTVRRLSSIGRVFFEPDPASALGRRAVFMAGVIRDVTAVHLAEERVRESEERLRLSNEAAGIGIFTVDLEAGCARYSPELAAMLGFPAVQTAKIEDAFKRVHRDDLSRVRAQFEAGLSGAGAGQIKADFRFVRPGGEVRWMTWAGRVHFREGQSGRIPFRIDGACVDITGRMRAEEAVRASEARFRGVFKHAGTGIAIKDLEGRFQSCNPAYASMLGYTEEELCALACEDLMHPDDRASNMAGQERLTAGGIPYFESVTRYFKKQGEILWGQRHVSQLQDDSGRPVGIIVLLTDMTQHKHQEEHINLLMREVNHRAKNMLTVVNSIARQTAATKPEDFIERFSERIEALAANQDLLVKNGWRGVDLGELVRSQLAHFKDSIGTRIDFKGPKVMLQAPAAQTLGMALHELATNAGKYGALSNGAGRVAVDWSLNRDGAGEEIFDISWRETGGPLVSAPETLGFGSAMIGSVAESSLGAKVELGFPASGFFWLLSCPAGEVMEGAGLGLQGSATT